MADKEIETKEEIQDKSKIEDSKEEKKLESADAPATQDPNTQGDLAKEAEKESLATEKPELSLEEKKKALLEKVKKLKSKVDVTKTSEELKEQVKIKKRDDMLIPLEEYVKAGIYLGTKVVTPDMKPFIYRRRADGLAIFNTDVIDEKIKEAIEYLNKFNAEDVILVCKRQAGWKAAKMFSELTGIRVFTKKYPAGVLTNTNLENFFENELTIVTDSWLDKNALKDTLNVRKKVLMICDTNNFSKGADKVIIGNNKHHKSLGVIFYLLTRGFCKAKGINKNIPDLDWWVEEEK
jgi:small subunit ribosomal protein S2